MRAKILACIVAGLCAAAPSAAAAGAHTKSTTYRGKTAQSKPIAITGGTGSLTLRSFQVRMLCHDGSLFFAGVSGFEPTPVKGGRFSDVQYGATDVVRWEGTVRRGAITGRLRVEDRLASGVRCASGPVRFTAKAG